MTKKTNRVEKIETNIYGDDDWATPIEALHNISIPMKNVEMLDVKKVKKFKLCTKSELIGIMGGMLAMFTFFLIVYLLIIFVG